MKPSFNSKIHFAKFIVLLVVSCVLQFATVTRLQGTTCNLTLNCGAINPTCYGNCDGSITVNVSGGSGNYGYLWSGGQTTSSVSLLCAATYTVTVTDLTTQCIKTKTFILKKAKVGAAFTSTNAHCGLCNGTITVTGKAGNGGPFTYLWSTGATTATITGVCPNVNYTVTVTDKKGCTFVCHKKVVNVGTTVDDNNVCTTDACDPLTGLTTHTPIDTDDNNVCTTDGCDPVTGCYHNAINCNDNNVCTTDGCDPVTGCYHNTVNTNDNNACTADGCDPVTGIYHNAINCDDNNVCTTDGCDPVTGCYHNAINCNDNNVCTTDGCDPVTGCYHNAINCNDNNVCTIDGCDPVTGCYHNPVNTNDNNACTTDGCDPVTGVYHNPITTPPTINCPANSVVSGGTNNGPCVDLGGGGVATVTNPNPTGQPSQVGIDFRQPRNQGHPVDPLDWTNGVNNITQAEYFEGMGNPQRLILTGLAGTSHTLRFRHEAVKHQSGDRHAYDFLMSWNQAIATAGNIGNGSLNELLNLNAQTCNGGIGATALAACTSVGNTATASIPDVMGNPPNHHGIANVDDVIQCFEAIYGNRTIEMDGNAAITAFSIAFDGYEGTAAGDNYAWYTISWTSASTDVMIKFAGRAAAGAGSCGYGSCYGAGSVSGAPYHFKLELLDGASTGNRDNQLMVDEIPCDLNIPVTFGTATSPDGTVTVITSDSVSNGNGSRTHCRRWRVTNSCNISSECSQCIEVVCSAGSRIAGIENIDGTTLSINPNPSQSKVNFDLVFDKDIAHVALEVFNTAGQKVAAPYQGAVLKGAQYHFEFDAGNMDQGVYFYHLDGEGISKTGKLVIIK